MRYILGLVLVVTMVGCASERDIRSMQQILSPDKMNMQLHVNPDIRNDSRTDTEIHQVRIGFDWNL
tara:strand:+ start:220 stop:417 length:198 start_codon:yes stop_codon:yes gene_type:complete